LGHGAAKRNCVLLTGTGVTMPAALENITGLITGCDVSLAFSHWLVLLWLVLLN
jgi:hypothetical protein